MYKYVTGIWNVGEINVVQNYSGKISVEMGPKLGTDCLSSLDWYRASHPRWKVGCVIKSETGRFF